MLSEEQKAYVHFLEKCDTKLLATAGSGKTLCIIEHMNYLIENGVYNPEEVHMLTFSKNAKDDFKNKIKENSRIRLDNINTIDSFAWYILGKEVTDKIDVSILSYTLSKVLKDMQDNDNNNKGEYQRIRGIKCIFCDEAQDLNETQYNILLLLKSISKATLHLIGDPNQNIYQFRKSSDRFLMEFQAKTFHLTRNYRSKGHIVDFCSYLRPYSASTISYTQDERAKPLNVMFYSYGTTACFEQYLLSTILFFKEKQIPLHKIAILAPTRGYLKNSKGMSKYKGLCYISNLLYQNSIPFKQFYNDSASSNNDQETTMNYQTPKINYKLTKNHINLMTYTASKGLEWDYVLLIDANAFLISKKNYSNDQYLAEQYLLYVACSRPRKNLIIFTKDHCTNAWFKNVPEDKYKVYKSLEYFDAAKLFANDGVDATNAEENNRYSLGYAINNLSEQDLFEINTILTQSEASNAITKDIKQIDDSGKYGKLKISSIRQGFAQKFLEHLFYLGSFNQPLDNTIILQDVRNLINSKNIIECNNDKVIDWYFKNRENMTWEEYEIQKRSNNIPVKIIEFVESRFDRDQLFSSYTIVDKFYDIFIAKNYKTIAEQYEKYKSGLYSLKNIMYMCLVSYAIETTHYFYVLQFDKFYHDIVKNKENKQIFEMITRYCQRHNRITADNFRQVFELERNVKLFTMLDIVKGNTFYVLKPLGLFRLKDMINIVVSKYIMNRDFDYQFISLEYGLIISGKVNLSQETYERIIEILLTNLKC